MKRPVRTAALHLLVLCGIALVSPTVLAYGHERAASPAGGDTVSANIDFYIEADGEPEDGVHYQIEIASDDEFELIVTRFDSKKSSAGWVFGNLQGVEDVPDKYRPVRYEGIHYRARGRLKNGVYFWRVSRSRGDGAFELLDGIAEFRVDTVPPGPVDSLLLDIDETGALELSWDPVFYDEQDGDERVAGYRVYRYTRLLKRYPVMTRYILRVTEDTKTFIPQETEDSASIVFYRVRAVDDVGNEEGRRRPSRLGEFEVKFNPPDLEQMVDQNWLRKQAEEDGL